MPIPPQPGRENTLHHSARPTRASRSACSRKTTGISENSNQALALVTGEYIGLLDHDDTLAPFALFEVVQALNEQP
jgi:hypothetical protein